MLAGEPATEATDVYGLGATLHACLTGSSPHPSTGGENVAALVARVLEEDPPPLAAQGVPPGLAAVVERAIARRPEERHTDATRFRHELERVSTAPVAPGPDPTQRLDATAADATPAEAGVPGEVARSYLTALDADERDRAWQMTTPRFQAIGN